MNLKVKINLTIDPQIGGQNQGFAHNTLVIDCAVPRQTASEKLIGGDLAES